MEWLIAGVTFIVVLLIIPVIVKFGNYANIYRENLFFQPVDTRKMVSVCPVKLPYSVSIKEIGDNNDSVSVVVEGERRCTLTYFLCVHADGLRKCVEEKKFTNERKLVDVLNLISFWISEPQTVSFSGEGPYVHTFSYNLLPVDVREKLHEILHDSVSQETCFPLLVHLQLGQEESDELVADNNVVSMVNVVTTTPPRASMSSPCSSTSSFDGSTSSSSGLSTAGVLKYNIAEQYIETLDGRVFLLKKLYKSGVDRLDDESHPSTSQSRPSTDHPECTESELCLVCQEYPVTRALLPCRHLCTCKSCFSKLDLCPICRQTISSYFVVQSEEDIPDSPPVNQNNDDIQSHIQNEGIWSFIKSIWNAS